MRWLALLMMIIALAACGSTPDLAFSDPEKLAAAYDLTDAKHEGDVELERTIKVTVDSAVKASDADSRFEVQVALARYTPSDRPLTVDIVTPGGAELGVVQARLQGKSVQPLTSGPSPEVALVDPSQAGWRFTFAAPASAPAAGQQLVLELIVRFAVEGTLAADAQWAAGPKTDTLLIRYDLAGDVQGTFQVTGAKMEPLMTQQAGRTVIALLVRKAYQYEGKVVARYATLRAAPKGYEQRFADTWPSATADYAEKLVTLSDSLNEGYAAPFAPSTTGEAGVREIFAWVKGRIQRADASAAAWDAGRGLKEPLEKNELTTTDKVHLLHWLLREAKIPHRFAMARSPRFEPITPESIPVPDAFTTPLIFASGLWLDPGCTACEAGQVRAELAGGQALLLPVPMKPELVTLPSVSGATP